MREKRIRTKMFNCWLHEKELSFLNDYAEKNMSTSSEIIRGWIHTVMISEGYEIFKGYKIKEPFNPENIKKRRPQKKGVESNE